MHIKKLKQARKKILFYRTHFGLNPPFQCLPDPLFLKTALDNKTFVKDLLPGLLQEKRAYLMVTQCVLGHLKKIGGEYQGAYVMARRLPVLKCGHNNNLPYTECICRFMEMQRDKMKFEPKTFQTHYFIAVQDSRLRASLRSMGGIPILFLYNDNILILEDISKKSFEMVAEKERKKTLPSDAEFAKIQRDKAKLESVGDNSEDEVEETENSNSSNEKENKKKRKGKEKVIEKTIEEENEEEEEEEEDENNENENNGNSESEENNEEEENEESNNIIERENDDNDNENNNNENGNEDDNERDNNFESNSKVSDFRQVTGESSEKGKRKRNKKGKGNIEIKRRKAE